MLDEHVQQKVVASIFNVSNAYVSQISTIHRALREIQMSNVFEDILNKPAKDILPPQPLPVGTYLAVIEPGFELKKMGKDNTDVIEYMIKIMQPMDDVDTTQYRDSVIGVKRRLRLWVTEDAEYRLRMFFVDTLGIDENMTIKQAMTEATNRTLMVTFKHTPAKDGSRLYDEIESYTKV